MSRSKPAQQDWFARSFDDHYARIYRYKDDTALAEVAHILRYLHLRHRRRAAPKQILDLACGWGRHSVPLAQRGFRVTGVDFSEVMLNLAEQRAIEEGLSVRWLGQDTGNGEAARADELTLLQADMRTLPFVAEFDAVLDIFTSFGYFRDPADNEAAVDSVYQALVPGGQFLLDVDNPQVFIDRRTGENVFAIPSNGGQERVLRVEKYARGPDRRVVEYSLIDRPSDEREEIYLECKLYDRRELTALLTDHGFIVDNKVWGDFEGHTFNAETSPRLIVVATKPRG